MLYMTSSRFAVNMAKAGDYDGAGVAVIENAKSLEAAMIDMNALAKFNDDGAMVDSGEAHARYEWSRSLVLSMIVCAAAVAAVLGIVIAQAMTAVSLARAVARGDLSREVTTTATGRDEVLPRL